MKYSLKILSLFSVLLIIVIFGFNVTNTYPKLLDDAYISPDQDSIFLSTKLYFVYEETLRSENRKIEVKNQNFEQAVIDSMKIGAKNVLYQSIFDYNVNVLSVDFANNICYVNFSEEFYQSAIWNSDQLDLYLWAIVNSLTEIDDVFEVQFLVDGERINESVLGFNLSEPLPRLESLNFIKERTPSDVSIEFIDSIISSRYDLAYNLLAETSQQVYDFDEFTKYAQTLNIEIAGFSRDLYFTKTYSDRSVIYVKFVKNVESNEYQVHFYKNWSVIKENLEFKIDLLN